MDFVSTVEHREGPGIWLAKRGVTFIALTRVGRWNFLAPSGDGSWATVPIGRRMPIFTHAQKAHWPETEYEVRASGVSAGTSASASAVYRFPKKGTELEKQMLAATPRVFVEGYRLALEKAIPDRAGAFVLFWGMSTGGASLYPLAKYYAPGWLPWVGHELHRTGPCHFDRGARWTVSTTFTTAWRCGCASAVSTTSSSTPRRSTPRPGHDGGRPRSVHRDSRAPRMRP